MKTPALAKFIFTVNSMQPGQHLHIYHNRNNHTIKTIFYPVINLDEDVVWGTDWKNEEIVTEQISAITHNAYISYEVLTTE